MPQYYYLKYIPKSDRARVVGNLERLIGQLDREVPDKDSEQTLLLATWNIRNFGKVRRLPESLMYIAEILSRFDFVAVQEVVDLDDWRAVMDRLGPDYDFIASDKTHHKLGSGGERLLYLYDKRKVRFQNIAGEIVLPTDMLITDDTAGEGGELYQGKQFRRSPFITAFQSGWFKFDICTVHLFYGSSSGSKLQQRVQEIDRVADYFGDRAEQAQKEGRSLILLGDFNIVHPDHETMTALKRHGFRIPNALNRPSNLDLSKYYDQIAFMTDDDTLNFIDRQTDDPKKANAGIFEIYKSVFRDGDTLEYESELRKKAGGKDKQGAALTKYYKGNWRTYQLSDHKPMWVRIKSNAAASYLAGLKLD